MSTPGAGDLDRAQTVAIAAAREAGALLLARAGDVHHLQYKGVVDLVTEVDLASEDLIRKKILGAFPDHSVLGEERGATERVAGARWIVDPLDGTTNYAHGFPFYCVSIGLELHGTMEVGVVYDPLRDELFLGRRSAGASLNGRPLRPSSRGKLIEALLATGFPYDRQRVPRALHAFEVLSLSAQAVRRAGSAALDLCYVAAGRLDGYWEFVVRPWDVAAGALIVEESGGHVTRIDGRPFCLADGEILAANTSLHPGLVAALEGI